LRICKVNGGIRGAPNGDPVELHARKEEAFLCWFLSRGIELLLEFNRPFVSDRLSRFIPNIIIFYCGFKCLPIRCLQ
jgi:hypothetical protein